MASTTDPSNFPLALSISLVKPHLFKIQTTTGYGLYSGYQRRMLVPPEFEDIEVVDEETYRVKKDGNWMPFSTSEFPFLF